MPLFREAPRCLPKSGTRKDEINWDEDSIEAFGRGIEQKQLGFRVQGSEEVTCNDN